VLLSLFRLWPLKKDEIEAFVNTIAQFTNTRSAAFIAAFTSGTIDDNQKRFIPHLAIDNDFFIACL
jgi:hypothetical protein